MIDSGVTWNHPAEKINIRGYNPATGAVNHNTGNWYDYLHTLEEQPHDDSQTHPYGTSCYGYYIENKNHRVETQ